jgi:hypothetical protein
MAFVIRPIWGVQMKRRQRGFSLVECFDIELNVSRLRLKDAKGIKDRCQIAGYIKGLEFCIGFARIHDKRYKSSK